MVRFCASSDSPYDWPQRCFGKDWMNWIPLLPVYFMIHPKRSQSSPWSYESLRSSTTTGKNSELNDKGRSNFFHLTKFQACCEKNLQHTLAECFMVRGNLTLLFNLIVILRSSMQNHSPKSHSLAALLEDLNSLATVLQFHCVLCPSYWYQGFKSVHVCCAEVHDLEALLKLWFQAGVFWDL